LCFEISALHPRCHSSKLSLCQKRTSADSFDHLVGNQQKIARDCKT
jgi:hypothetical protein